MRDRIMALSRSHDLLVNSDWVGASLSELVEEHLKPFGRENQIRIEGPPIRLSANAVQHLGMALHELGTNSAKYGALASDAGRLEIDWKITPRPDGLTDLHLTWEERFPPMAGERRFDTSRKGFGTVVLQRVAPQALAGHATMKREADRMTWTLVAPVETVVASEADCPKPLVRQSFAGPPSPPAAGPPERSRGSGRRALRSAVSTSVTCRKRADRDPPRAGRGHQAGTPLRPLTASATAPGVRKGRRVSRERRCARYGCRAAALQEPADALSPTRWGI